MDVDGKAERGLVAREEIDRLRRINAALHGNATSGAEDYLQTWRRVGSLCPSVPSPCPPCEPFPSPTACRTE